MSTRCCSTRPARSRSATARRPNSCRYPGFRNASWPMPRSSPHCPTRRPRAARLSFLPRKYAIRGRDMAPLNARFIAFSAQTRISGVDLEGNSIRKGAVDAVLAHVEGGSTAPVRLSAGGGGAVAVATATVSRSARELTQIAGGIAQQGGTPLAVALNGRLLG